MSVRNWLVNSTKWLAAGVEVSVFGSLFALSLMVVLSGFAGMHWYIYGNLFSIGLYPPSVLDARLGYWSFAGFALAFLYFVAIGMLFACVFRSRRRGVGPHLVGVAYSLLFFLAGDRLWWQAWSPYLVIYGVHAHLMWSHVLFGVVLGWLPARREKRDGDGEQEALHSETFSRSEST